MEIVQTKSDPPPKAKPAADGGGTKRNGKPRRRPKQGNSTEFDEILSACNVLSVNERVRLLKSLAGQHGLCVLTIEHAAALKAGNNVTPREENNVQPRVPVARNPLKGTAFEKDLQAAKDALRLRKSELGRDVPKEDPVYTQYIQALEAYRNEHRKLKPVTNGEVVSAVPASKKRVRTDKSPTPGTDSSRRTLSGRLGSLLRGRGKADDDEML